MSSQVKRKAAEVDEMIRQNAAAAQAEADAEATPDEVVLEESPGEPAEVVEIQPAEQELETQDTEEVVVEETPDYAAQIAAMREEADKANQRWRSLQGQLGSKDKQIEQLHELLGNLQSAQPAAEAAPPAPQGYNASDVEAFGEDMMDVIERVARSVFSQMYGDVGSKVESLASEVQAVSQHTAVAVAESFESKLDKQVNGDWRKLDTDTGFNDWLDETPARRHLFTQFAEQKDAASVAEFFNQYIAATGLAAEKQEVTQAKKKAELSKQVAPGKSRQQSTPAQSTPEEKIWTGTEVAQVYTDWQRKKISAEEFAKLEKQVTKAMGDGRVDYSK